MTIAEALAQADALRPNEFEAAVKLRWLSTLDGQIHAELLQAHAQLPGREASPDAPAAPASPNAADPLCRGGHWPPARGIPLPRGAASPDALDGPAPFSGYGPETELQSTSLLVPWPYDELYLRYLVMRIDLEHGELDRYNRYKNFSRNLHKAKFFIHWNRGFSGICKSLQKWDPGFWGKI